jgi:hypothetical protein
MPGFPNHLPAPPASGSPISCPQIDASEFDRDGTVRFGFVHNGVNIGYRLKIKVTTGCKDDNPFFIPWKDCRPFARVRVLQQSSYFFDRIPVIDVWKVLSFDARIETEETDDDECLMAYLIITVQSGTDILPGFQFGADLSSFLAKAKASGQVSPIESWTIPFRVCCEDCKAKLTFLDTEEQG